MGALETHLPNGKKQVEFIIEPTQAETVRMIFDMYLSGIGVGRIKYELERMGRMTATGKTKWYPSYISRLLKNSFYCGIITYHKEYTPDYLTQKKIKNYGEMELLKVNGSHKPIISVEEYEKAQRIVNERTGIVTSPKRGSGRRGQKTHSTAWGRLLICQCGKKFHQHFHSRKDREDGTDYQCYTSVNFGSQATRKNKGLSLSNTCDSPFIPGWKLELMSKKVFERYIDNASETVALAHEMLSKHIADKEETPDHTDDIKRKQLELEKLRKKKINLIEMREDGDIDKGYFQKRKEELDKSISALLLEIENLSPKNLPKPCDYQSVLSGLKKQLESYVACKEKKIPESVVEAFIEKIWVSKDEFRWYLRCGHSSGEEKDAEEHIKIAAFTIGIEEAKAYVYSISTKKRIYKWRVLNVSVWV